MSSRMLRDLSLLALCTLVPNPALAHAQGDVGSGLISGLLHPLTGIDHMIAMVAVGIWGAQLGAPAVWLLPITFPLVMAVGGVIGIMHVPLPAPEVMVALSALVLGGAVALRLRVPFAAAGAVVAVFAIFHGYAHGAELPHAADPLAYGFGFVVATGMLHLVGIAIGTLTYWPAGARVIQGLGVSIAFVGCYFLAQSLGALA